MLGKPLVFFFILFNFLESAGQGHKIQFQVEGLQDSIVTIGYILGPQKYAHDTLKVESGSFTIEGENPLTHGFYFVFTPTFYYEFIVKEQVFSITAKKESGYRDSRVEGSVENEIFSDFQITMAELKPEEIRLREKLKGSTGRDSLTIVSELEGVVSRIREYKENLFRTYPGTFFISFLKTMEEVSVPDFKEITDPRERQIVQYRYFKNHFFDQIALDEPALLRTPILHQKVMTYFEQVVPQHPDSINVAIDLFFDKVGESQELYKYWLINLYKKYEGSKVMGIDKVTVHLMEKYLLSDRADWLDTEGKKKIREEVAFTKPTLIGNKAPALVLVDTAQQPFYFEQITDPFILLYFYDPDCGHCKKNTPVLVDSYPELKGLGAEVVAVCTTTDVERWKEYILETNMEFPNLADPGYESNFRVHYNLRSTPKMYLLDHERKVVAKQLEIEGMIDFLKRYNQ